MQHAVAAEGGGEAPWATDTGKESMVEFEEQLLIAF